MKIYALLFIINVNVPLLFCSSNYVISGYIRDIETGEELIGAYVFVDSIKKSSISNNYGFYSITLPCGGYLLKYNFLGFEIIQRQIDLQNDTIIDIYLKKMPIELEEVHITAQNNYSSSLKYIQLSTKQIKELPSIFGEPDIVKALQLEPGIKNIGDGSSGLYIRGGNRDQNYVLIDEAPVYNLSHLIGFVSVFNPEMIKDVKLYNSYIPPKYGGRVSSILETNMKEGNLNKHSLSAAISTLSGRIAIEGPIAKNKSSFFISARKSSFDLFIEPSKDDFLVPGFYDLNTKINFKFNNKNRLFLSMYHGYDIIETYEEYINLWGNTTSTIRWNHLFNQKLFSNMSLIYSKYYNNLTFTNDTSKFDWITGVNDINFKYDLNWYKNPDSKFGFGLNTIFHKFTPGESNYTQRNISRSRAIENSLYIFHNKKINSLDINYGLRLANFFNIGKTTWYTLNEQYIPVKEHNEGKGIWNNYGIIEPRINISLNIKNKHNYYLAYTRTSQFMQVLSNNTMSYTFFETWIPASPNIKPLISNNLFSGYTFDNKIFNTSIEVYYKIIKNQIDYKDHATLINNPCIESELRRGKAYAYGIELSLKKQSGKTTGSISYVFSKVYYIIKNITFDEKYVAPYDIPHDFKILIKRQLSPKLNFSTFWTYTSGRPTTFPVAHYYLDKHEQDNEIKNVPIYTNRNTERFPNYHRLDLNLSYKTIGDKKVKHEIILGLYNAYARKNPLGYSFDSFDYGMGNNVLVYHFYTIIPNISYKIKFN